MHRRPNLSVHDYVRLAAACVVDPRTIKRVYAGEPCMSTTLVRVRRAALDLGLPPPTAETDAA